MNVNKQMWTVCSASGRLTGLNATLSLIMSLSHYDSYKIQWKFLLKSTWNSLTTSQKLTAVIFLRLYVLPKWLVEGLSFISRQHLKLYQGTYRLVTVHTHGDYIVLPNWEITASTMSRYPSQHSVTLSSHWVNQNLPYPIDAKCQARK